MSYFTNCTVVGVFRANDVDKAALSSVHATQDKAVAQVKWDREHIPDYCAAHKLIGLCAVKVDGAGKLSWSSSSVALLRVLGPTWAVS